MTRSIVAQMSSDQIYFVFRLANTNQPISHPSIPINMLLSLTQKQGLSWCFETCSGGKLPPRRGCETPEGKQESSFQTPEFHPQIIRRSDESQGTPKSTGPCPLFTGVPIVQASPIEVAFSWGLEVWNSNYQKLDKHRRKQFQ